jgi:uncharacterized membrane protein
MPDVAQSLISAEKGASRFASVDRLRGLIMVIMAVDHASLFIAHRHSSEVWNDNITRYSTALPFLTRFVTHLCAPGFFFLMGVGIAMFAASRAKAGWSQSRISIYMLTRGLVLIAVNELVENPTWIIGTAFQNGSRMSVIPEHNPTYLVFGVISALGIVMALCGLMLRLPSTMWLVLSAAVLVGSNLLVPGPAHNRDFFPVIARLLLPGRSGIMLVLYPPLPWVPLAGFGVVFGRGLLKDSRSALRLAPWMGAGLIIAALVMRHYGSFGNIRLPRDGSWIEFLNFVKYPPAMVFVFFTLGCNLILLAALAGRASRITEVLSVYGRAPLCFYIAHLYLYAIAGALFFRSPTTPQGLYVVWILGLIPLYFICQRYRAFKERRPPESLWRLF